MKPWWWHREWILWWGECIETRDPVCCRWQDTGLALRRLNSLVARLLLPSIVPGIRVFSNESAFPIRWSKFWSFSFSVSLSNEYSGLISFRIDWFDLLTVQGLSRVFSNTIVQKHQFLNIQPSLWSNSHIHTWQNHSLDYTDLCRKSYVSAFYFF